MATRLSRFLKLRIDDARLTSDSIYNLERLDLLGSSFSTDSSDSLNLKSRLGITLQPNSVDLGGSGTGGTVNIGTSDQPVSTFNIYADSFVLSEGVSLADDATGGTKNLILKYKSDVNGSVDTTADRFLNIDVEGSNRNITLAGDLSLLSGSVTFTSAGPSSVTLPSSGTLSTLAGTETLTNKTISASSNTLSDITNSSIDASAAIAGTKIAPDFGTQNIVTSGELRLEDGDTNYIALKANASLASNVTFTLPTADGTANQVMSTDGAGNLFFATGATTSLPNDNIRVGDGAGVQAQVDTSSVGDILADHTTGLTIKAGVIVDADVNASAALTLSKLAAVTASRALESDGSGIITASAVTSTELGHLSGVTSAIQTQLDAKQPDVLTTRGDLIYRDATNTTARLPVGTANDVLTTDGIDVGYSKLFDANIDATAAISLSKLATVTASRALESDGSGLITPSAVTSTELGYLSGVTSAIQTQLDAKIADSILTTRGDLIYRDATNTTARLPLGVNNSVLVSAGLDASYQFIADANIGASAAIQFSKMQDLTVNRALESNGSGDVSVSAVTSTELGYLSGVTSAIQTQLDAKSDIQSFTATWLNADGTTKVVTHNLGTRAIAITIYDDSTFETIYPDTEIRTDTNTLTLTAAVAPSVSWSVLIHTIQ